MARPRYARSVAPRREPELTISGDVAEFPVECALGDGWTIKAVLVPEGGRPVIRELHVTPSGDVPPGGLPARLLRSVKVEDIENAARERYHRELRDPEWHDAIAH